MAGSRIFNSTNFYQESANGADYQGLSGFSIAAWVYRPTTGVYTIPYAISNGSSNSIALYWWTDNILYMDVRTSSSAKYRNSAANTTTGWVHVAGVFDGSLADTSRMKVYINAVDVTSAGTTINPTVTSSSLATYGKVGRLDLTPINISNNNGLAHVSLYNVALQPSEIRELMLKPASPQRGRLHYWPLNGNDASNETDHNRIHYLTGNNIAASTASMLSPSVCIGGSTQCH